MHPETTPNKARNRSRKWLAPIALVLGCSVCLLPGLLVGGVVGGTLGGALAWASGVSAWLAGGIFLLALGGFLTYRRIRATDSPNGESCSTSGACQTPACSCGGGPRDAVEAT